MFPLSILIQCFWIASCLSAMLAAAPGTSNQNQNKIDLDPIGQEKVRNAHQKIMATFHRQLDLLEKDSMTTYRRRFSHASPKSQINDKFLTKRATSIDREKKFRESLRAHQNVTMENFGPKAMLILQKAAASDVTTQSSVDRQVDRVKKQLAQAWEMSVDSAWGSSMTLEKRMLPITHIPKMEIPRIEIPNLERPPRPDSPRMASHPNHIPAPQERKQAPLQSVKTGEKAEAQRASQGQQEIVPDVDQPTSNPAKKSSSPEQATADKNTEELKEQETSAEAQTHTDKTSSTANNPDTKDNKEHSKEGDKKGDEKDSSKDGESRPNGYTEEKSDGSLAEPEQNGNSFIGFFQQSHVILGSIALGIAGIAMIIAEVVEHKRHPPAKVSAENSFQ